MRLSVMYKTNLWKIMKNIENGLNRWTQKMWPLDMPHNLANPVVILQIL